MIKLYELKICFDENGGERERRKKNIVQENTQTGGNWGTFYKFMEKLIRRNFNNINWSLWMKLYWIGRHHYCVCHKRHALRFFREICSTHSLWIIKWYIVNNMPIRWFQRFDSLILHAIFGNFCYWRKMKTIWQKEIWHGICCVWKKKFEAFFDLTISQFFCMAFKAQNVFSQISTHVDCLGWDFLGMFFFLSHIMFHIVKHLPWDKCSISSTDFTDKKRKQKMFVSWEHVQFELYQMLIKPLHVIESFGIVIFFMVGS